MDFKNLVKSNRNNVRSIIKLITKETNEDLEQDVFFKVWKNSDKYKEQGTLKSWVNMIAKNTSKDYVKSAHYKNQNTQDDEILTTINDEKPSPELVLIHTERQEKITKAINSLKPRFKEVIMYCEIYGYSYEDASKKLNCPLGTIKSRLYNAKRELAEKLKDLL